METQDSHAPASDKTFHFPTAGLSISGDLNNVKLKSGTIAQLVRALQQSNNTKPAVPADPKPKTAKKKIIHPSQLITKHTLQKQGNKNGKKLYYGDALPETISVSSQSVKVVPPSGNTNNTGQKRTSRHLTAFIGNNPSAVRTVEGVRVPDDEHDKHYTWRNARVIKGFLVPNDRPANPHKKRQVIITDPQQYLAAAAAAQASGATTIIDASALHNHQQQQLQQQRSSNNGQSRTHQQQQTQTSLFYAQEPAGSAGAGGLSQNEQQQQRSHHHQQHPHVNYPNQQHHQHQSANNGQTSQTFSYAQQNPHNMYVVQDGSQNNLKYSNNHHNQAASSSQSLHQQLAQQQAQAQFFSRSGEAPIAPVSSSSANPQQQQQQRGSENSSQQTLSAAIKQQQYQPSLDTQAIQAAVEAVQQLEAQQQAASSQQQHQQHLHHHQQQQPQQQQQTLSVSGITLNQQGQQQESPAIQQATQQQIAALLAQQSAPSQSIVLPQGIGGATAQEILAATQAATNNGQLTAQYLQIQQGHEQPLQLQLQQQQQLAAQGSQQQQQQQQQQFPAPDQFSERQQFPGAAAAYPASSTQFVIQPQTYIAGAGGQTFTVPIPVPVDQAVAQQQAQQLQQQQQLQLQQQQQQQQQARLHQQYNQHQQQQQQQQHHQYQQQQPYLSGANGQGNNRQYQPGQNPNLPSITDRMKQAFNQNFNRKMLERVETNAVVPALASTGLFLGLSALAAGWYLSKNNREVGIVRRTGKFSKKKGSIIPTLNAGGDISTPEVKDEGTANTRTRRDLASMVTPQGYQPSGAPEVDQATFFQSIIQQSLEKTQKEYDDQPDQMYNPNQDGGSHHQMDNFQQQGPVGYHRGDVEPDRHSPPGPPPPPSGPPSRFRSGNRFNRYNDRPAKYFREQDDFYDPANSRISKSQAIQEKSGWSVHSAKNFARVAIPAVVLTGAALGICAVIFGWYISGDNREIAFLESPTTNSIGGGSHGQQGGWSRRKRSLFPPSAPSWSDGWLIRTLKAIHGNPYDSMPAPTAKSFVPYPYFLDKDSSKTSTMEFKVSNNGLASVIAGGAVLAVVALGLINSFAESSGRNLKTARYNRLLTSSGSTDGGAASSSLTKSSSTNPLTHLRSPRNYFENNLEFQEMATKPSFFEQILQSVEGTGSGLFSKLQDMSASSTWQKSSCIKSLLCRSISSQGDETVGLMEKRMATVMKMLPESVSSSINKNFSDVLAAIYRRDCSAFTCSHSAPVVEAQKKEENEKESESAAAATPVVVQQKRRRPVKRIVSSQKKKAKSSIKNQQTVITNKSKSS